MSGFVQLALDIAQRRAAILERLAAERQRQHYKQTLTAEEMKSLLLLVDEICGISAEQRSHSSGSKRRWRHMLTSHPQAWPYKSLTRLSLRHRVCPSSKTTGNLHHQNGMVLLSLRHSRQINFRKGEHSMRRISILMAAVLILTALVYTYGQPPPGDSKRQTPAEKVKGKALVKRLPSGTEGVELKRGAVWAKTGYKFVKQSDGTVIVARIARGGNGLMGTWSCKCGSDKGSCVATTDGRSLVCSTDGVCKKCTLQVETSGATSSIMAY
jgi:hypothetical protein